MGRESRQPKLSVYTRDKPGTLDLDVLTLFIVGILRDDVVERVLDELVVHAHHVPLLVPRARQCRAAAVGRRLRLRSHALVEHLQGGLVIDGMI